METEGKGPGGVSTAIRIVGHEAELARVTNALRSGRGTQSYLIVGPPSVGKTTAARFVAQWLLCADARPGRPCGACRGCRLAAAGAHPDICDLEAPIKIAAVRELQHRLALAPMEGRWHVAILPEVETASHGACNCLLKTLEEPPSGAMLLLTASDPAALLATVRSRCREVRLRPLSVEIAARALVTHWDVSEDEAAVLARISGGRLGWAIRALADPKLLEHRTEWLHRLEQVLGDGPAARFERADAWGRQADALAEGLLTWRGWWRDVLLLQHGLEDAVVNRDRIGTLAAAAGRYATGETVRALRAVDSAIGHLSRSANAPLETAVLLMEMPS